MNTSLSSPKEDGGIASALFNFPAGGVMLGAQGNPKVTMTGDQEFGF